MQAMTVESNGLKRTPLYGEHLSEGARLMEFAGWEMPISFPVWVREIHSQISFNHLCVQ